MELEHENLDFKILAEYFENQIELGQLRFYSPHVDFENSRRPTSTRDWWMNPGLLGAIIITDDY